MTTSVKPSRPLLARGLTAWAGRASCYRPRNVPATPPSTVLLRDSRWRRRVGGWQLLPQEHRVAEPDYLPTGHGSLERDFTNPYVLLRGSSFAPTRPQKKRLAALAPNQLSFRRHLLLTSRKSERPRISLVSAPIMGTRLSLDSRWKRLIPAEWPAINHPREAPVSVHAEGRRTLDFASSLPNPLVAQGVKLARGNVFLAKRRIVTTSVFSPPRPSVSRDDLSGTRLSLDSRWKRLIPEEWPAINHPREPEVVLHLSGKHSVDWSNVLPSALVARASAKTVAPSTVWLARRRVTTTERFSPSRPRSSRDTPLGARLSLDSRWTRLIPASWGQPRPTSFVFAPSHEQVATLHPFAKNADIVTARQTLRPHVPALRRGSALPRAAFAYTSRRAYSSSFPTGEEGKLVYTCPEDPKWRTMVLGAGTIVFSAEISMMLMAQTIMPPPPEEQLTGVVGAMVSFWQSPAVNLGALGLILYASYRTAVFNESTAAKAFHAPNGDVLVQPFNKLGQAMGVLNRMDSKERASDENLASNTRIVGPYRFFRRGFVGATDAERDETMLSLGFGTWLQSQYNPTVLMKDGSVKAVKNPKN